MWPFYKKALRDHLHADLAPERRSLIGGQKKLFVSFDWFKDQYNDDEMLPDNHLPAVFLDVLVGNANHQVGGGIVGDAMIQLHLVQRTLADTRSGATTEAAGDMVWLHLQELIRRATRYTWYDNNIGAVSNLLFRGFEPIQDLQKQNIKIFRLDFEARFNDYTTERLGKEAIEAQIGTYKLDLEMAANGLPDEDADDGTTGITVTAGSTALATLSGLDGRVDTLESQMQAEATEPVVLDVAAPEDNQTLTAFLAASFAGRIAKVWHVTDAGSCNLTVNIAGSAVADYTGLGATTGKSSAGSSAGDTNFAAGDAITINLGNVSSAEYLTIQLDLLRT